MDKHIKHPSELFKKGQSSQSRYFKKIDKEKERLSLGYKQLISDPWVSKGYSPAISCCEVTTGKFKIIRLWVFVELEGK